MSMALRFTNRWTPACKLRAHVSVITTSSSYYATLLYRYYYYYYYYYIPSPTLLVYDGRRVYLLNIITCLVHWRRKPDRWTQNERRGKVSGAPSSLRHRLQSVLQTYSCPSVRPSACAHTSVLSLYCVVISGYWYHIYPRIPCYLYQKTTRKIHVRSSFYGFFRSYLQSLSSSSSLVNDRFFFWFFLAPQMIYLQFVRYTGRAFGVL